MRKKKMEKGEKERTVGVGKKGEGCGCKEEEGRREKGELRG